MAEPMFKIVSEPATEDWCGDCDEDSDRNSDNIHCLNQPGSAMAVLIGAEEDGAFAVCKYHRGEWIYKGLV